MTPTSSRSPSEQFHEAMAARQRDWPQAMTALSTHDTKRSEDVRARITALAEVPDEWASDDHRAPAARADARCRAGQPALAGRGRRLADHHASGSMPTPRRRCARAASTPPGPIPMRDFEGACTPHSMRRTTTTRSPRSSMAIVARIEPAGRSNALAAKLLALTLPGVPDVYQGTELGDLSLVDPDNRRPVDFDAAALSLADGSNAKQSLTAEALRLRRDRPELFTSYDAVLAEGPAADHVLAFDRGGAITVVTRLPLGLEAKGGWGDTVLRLPDGSDSRRRDPRRAARPTIVVLPMSRGRFDVWAPYPKRVRLSVGDEVVEMTRGADDWWSPDGPVPDGEVDYGYLLDDSEQVLPDPRSRRQPHGVHERSRTFDPTAFEWTDEHWTGRQLAGSVLYELHLGTFTPEGTLDAAIEQARPPRHARRRPGRAAAGQRVQRHPQLGVRRRAVVGRPRAVRRPGGVPALRRRRPRRRSRRRPGRRLQPPRAVGELPAAVRSLPEERGREHLGLAGQPRRRRARRRYAASSSTAPSPGCATSTSTGCGSTPCTRSPTSPTCTCSRSSPSRWAPSRRTCDGR